MLRTLEKTLGWILFAALVLVVGSITPPAHAAGTLITAKAVTCPASGSSIQLAAANPARESYLINNTSGATVRFGFLASGTATLDDTNSILLLAGQSFSDAAPSIFIGRMVCMSADATPDVIYIIESRRN